MSFYTALTGLNAATASLGVISNNIANVGTTGFKRSRADFGDIFATSPLQKASSVIGQGVALKGVTQEFSQGNLQFSASVLDIAITGDGFFPLKSADGLQDIYTRNGTFILDDSFSVVNSAGQALMAASVDSQGKADLETLRKLVIPRSTNGDARETTEIEFGLNLPADAPVITTKFDPSDPNTYGLTTAVTIFDAGGNEYLATVYYVKTQRASPEDPTNKWQTHVLIGDTKLDELLIQAQSNAGEKLFVNKYGQVKAEAEIPPQDIARGVTKLFNLDRLANKQASVSAEFVGRQVGPVQLNNLKAGEHYLFPDLVGLDQDALDDLDDEVALSGLQVTLNVDDSPSPVRVDLSDLILNEDGAIDIRKANTKYSGIELSRILEARINKAYGDERYFDLDSLVASDEERPDTYDLLRIRIGNEPEAKISLNLAGDIDEETGLFVFEDETFSDIALAPGERPPADLKTDTLTRLLQRAINRDPVEDDGELGSGGVGVNEDGSPRVLIRYSAEKQTFLITPTDNKAELRIGAFDNNRVNEVFGLGRELTSIDLESGTYGGLAIPNGATIRASNSNYGQSDQRTGIRVRFNDETGTFSIFSGTTGDRSSVAILAPLADPLSIDEVEGERIDAETLAQARQAGTSDNPRIAAYLNFLNIFELEPGDTPVERLPLRGVRSTPAIVQGNPIGINLDNKFTLNPETSTFTVTVDNVTGLIQLPVGREFTKESFRRLLEDRINSLEDSRGRTVANVKVEYKTEGNITRLEVTTGTEGNDSFLKISGPSIWGLRDLPNGRGTTERWIAPPQAENDNGVPLYVDRDGNETTEAGEFSEEEARDLYAPIFLDKGELTFSNRGELVSPAVPINFKPATIEETGATLQFAINYDGTTQFSSPFGVLAQTQNGRPEGDLIGLDVADDGLVTAQYSNGSQNNLAKIILSNFTNPQGLRQIGDASYYATSKSGLITFGEPGKAGFGTVRSGARERANVDLTQELIDLITAQRAFQANAKAIETNNTLTQAIINIRS